MVLPHQLGLVTTSKGNAAKPDASCAQQELDDEQRDGDQAKGLRNKMDSVSMLHEGGKMHVSYSMPGCEVGSTVRCLVSEHCGGAQGDA
jgi:hypothetical protein